MKKNINVHKTEYGHTVSWSIPMCNGQRVNLGVEAFKTKSQMKKFIETELLKL